MKEILSSSVKANSTTSQFRLAVAAGGVHLVELSQTMRRMQFQALRCTLADGSTSNTAIAVRCKREYIFVLHYDFISIIFIIVRMMVYQMGRDS